MSDEAALATAAAVAYLRAFAQKLVYARRVALREPNLIEVWRQETLESKVGEVESLEGSWVEGPTLPHQRFELLHPLSPELPTYVEFVRLRMQPPNAPDLVTAQRLTVSIWYYDEGHPDLELTSAKVSTPMRKALLAHLLPVAVATVAFPHALQGDRALRIERTERKSVRGQELMCTLISAILVVDERHIMPDGPPPTNAPLELGKRVPVAVRLARQDGDVIETVIEGEVVRVDSDGRPL